jgi:hypothetical protein
MQLGTGGSVEHAAKRCCFCPRSERFVAGGIDDRCGRGPGARSRGRLTLASAGQSRRDVSVRRDDRGSSAAAARSVSARTPARAGKHAPRRAAWPRAGVGAAARRRTPRRADPGLRVGRRTRSGGAREFSSRASVSLAAISRRLTRRIACPLWSSLTARSAASSWSAVRRRIGRAPRRPLIRARGVAVFTCAPAARPIPRRDARGGRRAHP